MAIFTMPLMAEKETGDPELGRRLREARIRAGFTQTEVVQRLADEEHGQSWLSNIENGRKRILLEDLTPLARLYNTTTDDLLGLTGPRPDYAVIAVPIYESWGHAGPEGGGLVTDYTYIPRSKVAGPNVVGVPVEGDCMVPDLNPGEAAIVDKDRTAKHGEIVAVTIDDEMYFYRADFRNGEMWLTNNRGQIRGEGARIEGVVPMAVRHFRRAE